MSFLSKHAFTLLFILLAGSGLLRAAPLVPKESSMIQDWPEWRWTILAGDDALRSGLPGMAEILYHSVLQLELPEDARQAVMLKLISALIAERRFEQAESLLNQMPGDSSPPYLLRQAIIAFNLGALDLADETLDQIDPDFLSRSDRAWYYLVKGLIARSKGQTNRAVGWIEQAVGASSTPAQRAHFDTLLLTSRFAEAPPTEEFANLLAGKVRDNHGTRPGFGYAREYAVALDRLGDKSGAIQVLQEQLTLITPDEPDEKAQTLLMIGLIAGQDSRRGQLALEDIVREGRDPALQRMALYLLTDARRDPAQEEAFRNFLTSLINTANPLRDEILMLRARLHLNDGSRSLAIADAERLLAEFPASPFGNEALWILGYVAWQDKRYRSAADYLQRIRDRLPPGNERNRLGQLVGDCYFSNGDFAIAASVYRSVLQSSPEPERQSIVAYQAIISEINAGRLDEAASALDSATLLGQIDSIRLWRAEWNLVEALRREGRTTEAYARLSYKLRGRPAESLLPELRLRLMWLSAFLSFEAGEYGSVPAMVNDALTMLSTSEHDQLPGEDRRLLASSLLLLEGRSLLRSDQPEEGIAVLERLRQDYPGTDAAITSYLVESRFLASEYRLAEAQRRLRELADRYENSPLAPAALLEAATLAEKQGQTRNYEEARDILKVLLERHPGDPLVFHAKLQLGNITRKLNLFGAAQILYENILQEYAGRDRDYPLYLAELYRADSMLAQAGSDHNRLDAAAESLDRVLDGTETPFDVRIEAGYKLALIQARQGHTLRARETLWLMVTRFLKDPRSAERLGPRGRYWMSRSLLELGGLLDSAGEVREAREVYNLISTYGLPGETLAAARSARTNGGG